MPVDMGQCPDCHGKGCPQCANSGKRPIRITDNNGTITASVIRSEIGKKICPCKGKGCPKCR